MTPTPTLKPFPEHFTWGFAAAAAQIEGAAASYGKGDSVWDVFARQPGNVAGGDTLDVACDHYHRYAEDIDLMAALGARHYRLSISWPRVLPHGQGPVNPEGMAFYDRVIDKCLAVGITPWVTMYHWDTPQALEEAFGGWRSRRIVPAFGAYADLIVKAYGDRVKHWMTVNEIKCFTRLSYGSGQRAPGLQLSEQTVHQTFHHALLAHGEGVRAVREHGGAGARVGLADDSAVFLPLTETAADIDAARQLYITHSAHLLGPVYKGHYSDEHLRAVGSDAPIVEAGDLASISQPLDFHGMNLYSGRFARAGADGQPEVLPFPASFPVADAKWLSLTPQVLYWGPRLAAEVLGVRDIVITENGAGYDDVPATNGEVLDLHRREVLRGCLRELQRAIDDGVPVSGYFLWSFMDNFEWEEGYQRRFGVVYTDYASQARTPKASARWYSQVMQGNAIV